MTDEKIALVVSFKNKEELQDWLLVWQAYKQLPTHQVKK